MNYIIENGINFYDELYKSLDDVPIENEDASGASMCLISNEPLIENYVTLECGHKFNYVPVFNDIMNHKKKYNAMETRILKTMEIRCPYCRNIQKTLLPYITGMGVKKVHGVNFYDELHVLVNMPMCKYTSTQNVQDYKKGKCCFLVGDVPCTSNMVTVLHETKEKFCGSHFYSGKARYINQKKKEMKIQIAEAKKKVAEEKLATKLEAKKKALEDKLHAKLDKKNKALQEKQKSEFNKKESKTYETYETNEIISTIIVSNDPICQAILSSGKNKGTQCEYIVHQDNLCTRHYNLMCKKNNKGNQSIISN